MHRKKSQSNFYLIKVMPLLYQLKKGKKRNFFSDFFRRLITYTITNEICYTNIFAVNQNHTRILTEIRNEFAELAISQYKYIAAQYHEVIPVII